MFQARLPHWHSVKVRARAPCSGRVSSPARASKHTKHNNLFFMLLFGWWRSSIPWRGRWGRVCLHQQPSQDEPYGQYLTISAFSPSYVEFRSSGRVLNGLQSANMQPRVQTRSAPSGRGFPLLQRARASIHRTPGENRAPQLGTR